MYRTKKAGVPPKRWKWLLAYLSTNRKKWWDWLYFQERRCTHRPQQSPHCASRASSPSDGQPRTGRSRCRQRKFCRRPTDRCIATSCPRSQLCLLPCPPRSILKSRADELRRTPAMAGVRARSLHGTCHLECRKWPTKDGHWLLERISKGRFAIRPQELTTSQIKALLIAYRMKAASTPDVEGANTLSIRSWEAPSSLLTHQAVSIQANL